MRGWGGGGIASAEVTFGIAMGKYRTVSPEAFSYTWAAAAHPAAPPPRVG